MLLSIIVPCYNEQAFIQAVLERVTGVTIVGGVEKEIIVVDDGSTDGTVELARSYAATNPSFHIRVIAQEQNKGKGAAIRRGIMEATGDFMIIQDADLEYDPSEYAKLLKPMLDGHADVVYGSRFRGSEAHRILFFLHSTGNKFLTTMSNLFTGLNLTDMETGYKLFRGDVLRSLTLKENRFGFEPEVTARISKIRGLRIYEVGISYYGRSYADGKKIGWVDGVRAIWCIIRYNLFARHQTKL